MRTMRRMRIRVLIPAAALVLVLGGVALTSRAAPADFAPFTMRVTYWTAAALQREGLPPESGLAVSILEYRTIDNWKVTVMSSSWDPGAVGTAVEVKNGTDSTFIAQARKLVSRTRPQDEVGKMGPYRWIYPGLIDTLPQQGFARLGTSRIGTVTYVESSARTVTQADGTTEVLTGTIVMFDLATRLPLDVKTYRDGALRESLDFAK